MATNRDFRDLLSALSEAGAEFLVVGAHAVMVYTAPRYTNDFDLWVRPSPENAPRVLEALRAFGAPLVDLTVDDLATPGTIFQIGVEPNRVDIITSIDGVGFEAAWAGRRRTRYDDVEIAVLGIDDLIANKRASGRPQALLDLARLEQAKESRREV